LPGLTRQAIVDEACRIVESEGHEALSLRVLAARLGVTAPALYDHVESKADLLELVAAEGYVELGERLESVAAEGVERFRLQSKTYVRFAVDHPELFRLMFTYRPGAIPAPADALGAATTSFDRGIAGVEAAMAAGLLPAGDPLRVATLFWTATHGAATVLTMAPDLGDDLVDDLVDVIVAGLQAERSPV